MRAYRVRGVGKVEAELSWKGMDGVAYVPVGGTNRSYVTVSPKLAKVSKGEGTLHEVDFKAAADGTMELVPVSKAKASIERNRGAIVVIPTGGFEFHFGPEQLAVNPRCGNACRVVVLQPGEEISAYPKVKTHAEALDAKPLALRYDGQQVTFQVA